MKLRKDSLGGMVLALGLICIASAALLAYVYEITEEPIRRADAERSVAAIAAVLPPFANDPSSDAIVVYGEGDTDAVTLYPAYDNDGRFVGAAISTWTDKGFSGRFDLMVGFDSSGAVTGYEVLNHTETPGLGAKMAGWFNSGNADDPRNVIGRTLPPEGLRVSKDGGDVDAITAATITSRAFLEALNRASRAFTSYTSQHGSRQKP